MAHTIWQNDNIDFSDWEELFAEEEELRETTLSETEKWDFIDEELTRWLDNERDNLSGIIYPNGIVAIADLGRWNGRHSGYKLINSGKVSDCLYSNCDYVEWKVNSHHQFECRESHHDETNYIQYRAFKENISETQKNNFLDKIYNGTYKPSDVSRYTKPIGRDIEKVYGWC